MSCVNGVASGYFLSKELQDTLEEITTSNGGDVNAALAEMAQEVIPNEVKALQAKMNYLVDGFTKDELDETVNTMAYMIANIDLPNVRGRYDKVLETFKRWAAHAKNEGDIEKAVRFHKVVKQFHVIAPMVSDRLNVLGLSHRKIQFSEVTEEDLEDQFDEEDGDRSKDRYGDDVRFSKDYKNTASARFKLFLARVKKVKWGNFAVPSNVVSTELWEGPGIVVVPTNMTGTFGRATEAEAVSKGILVAGDGRTVAYKSGTLTLPVRNSISEKENPELVKANFLAIRKFLDSRPGSETQASCRAS